MAEQQPETPELHAARQRLASIEQFERNVRENREQVANEKADAQQAVEAAQKEVVDAEQLARTSGKPFDVALSEIRAARGGGEAAVDAMNLSREEYARHRQKHGLGGW